MPKAEDVRRGFEGTVTGEGSVSVIRMKDIAINEQSTQTYPTTGPPNAYATLAPVAHTTPMVGSVYPETVGATTAPLATQSSMPVGLTVAPSGTLGTTPMPPEMTSAALPNAVE